MVLKNKKTIAAIVIVLIIGLFASVTGYVSAKNYAVDGCKLARAKITLSGKQYNVDGKSYSFSKKWSTLKITSLVADITNAPGKKCWGKTFAPPSKHPILVLYSYTDSTNPKDWKVFASEKNAKETDVIEPKTIDIKKKNNIYIKVYLAYKDHVNINTNKYNELVPQSNEVKQVHLYRELTKPTMASAKSKTDYSAEIKWSRDANSNGYAIYMSTSKKGKYTLKKTVSKNTTKSSTVTDLKANKKYYFKVKSYNNKGTKKVYSTFSNVKSAKTKKAKIANVSKVKAKKSGKKAAKLTWKKTGKAQGYVVYMSTSKNGKYKKVTTLKGAQKTTYIKKSLKKGKTYYFKVKAYTKIKGKTWYSNSAKIVKVKR